MEETLNILIYIYIEELFPTLHINLYINLYIRFILDLYINMYMQQIFVHLP